MQEYTNYMNYLAFKIGAELPNDVAKKRDNIGIYYQVGSYCFTNPRYALNYSTIYQNLKDVYK